MPQSASPVRRRSAISGPPTWSPTSAASAISRQGDLLHAASHDLRQPLQTACLLQELLAQRLEGHDAEPLVGRIATALGALSGLVNHLVDAHEIEFGAFEPDPVAMPVSRLLRNVMSEIGYHAEAREVSLRVAGGGVLAAADPRLFGHMLRNLVWHAVTQTTSGRVLVGCRRRGDRIAVEIWYGGRAAEEPDPRRSRGSRAGGAARRWGVGESIASVCELGDRFGHPVERRSHRDSHLILALTAPRQGSRPAAVRALSHPVRGARVFVVEDNPSVRETIALSLTSIGHEVDAAANGAEALARVRGDAPAPDILLVDYNLPGPMNGLAVAAAIREHYARPLPVLILTGNMSNAARAAIAESRFPQIAKPVRLSELRERLACFLPEAGRPAGDLAAGDGAPADEEASTVFVVDDDGHVRQSLRTVLESRRYRVEDFDSGEAFLARASFPEGACLIIDAYLPRMSGLAVLERLNARGCAMPSIMVTGHADVRMAVLAMKHGASEFIEKPIATRELLSGIRNAVLRSRDSHAKGLRRETAVSRLARLTPKQRLVLERILDGQLNKVIAYELGVSQRTVESHRAEIMARTATRSLPELARLHMDAGGG